ncbi:MAG: hypothetical protein GY820_39910 [Gammaproteobacteria bacterium]|nr:hypothetical protein [Gammaproteobacteria bacterium]
MSNEFYYPEETDSASKRLRWVADHLERVIMCLSCAHHGGKCPDVADGETNPCPGHEHRDNLIAENLTDDLRVMGGTISRVKDLEAFLENSKNEEMKCD